nr:SGNH hydrolase domain-containing protein [Primorskyibacter marinus]
MVRTLGAAGRGCWGHRHFSRLPRCAAAQDMRYDATCVLGAAGVAPDTVIWGDSHGVELTYAWSERAALSGRAVRQITGSACPPTPGVYLQSRPRCQAANKDILDALLADDTVTRIVLTPILCGPEICPIVSDDEVLYFNGSHISMTAARRVVLTLEAGS